MGLTPEQSWAAVSEELLGEPGVEVGRMLRAGALRYDGRYFALLHPDGLVVKLPAARVEELVGNGTASRFPSGQRPMREWAAVPAERQERWHEVAREALSFARR